MQSCDEIWDRLNLVYELHIHLPEMYKISSEHTPHGNRYFFGSNEYDHIIRTVYAMAEHLEFHDSAQEADLTRYINLKILSSKLKKKCSKSILG